MNTVITILILPILAYLFVTSFYQLVLALASKRYNSPNISGSEDQRVCVVVPCYKSDETILTSCRYNMKVIRENEGSDLLIIADQLQKSTIQELKALGAKVVEVSYEKSTKVKALNCAVAYLKSHHTYDSVLVLDADNLLHHKFSKVTSFYHQQGYPCIQGERLPMNQDTTLAILDGLSEKANQEMLCKGANVFGMSSKLTGSAMSFNFYLFMRVIPELNAVGGFDKELELLLTSQDVFVKYTPELMVLDEKVRSSADFEKQRGRWLQSQYAFLAKSLSPALAKAKGGNFDYLHKSLQLALPPRIIAPLAWIALIALALITGSNLVFSFSVIGFVGLMSSYLISIPFHWWAGHLPSILRALPRLFLSGFKSLFWMKRAKTQFLHTRHQAAIS